MPDILEQPEWRPRVATSNYAKLSAQAGYVNYARRCVDLAHVHLGCGYAIHPETDLEANTGLPLDTPEPSLEFLTIAADLAQRAAGSLKLALQRRKQQDDEERAILRIEQDSSAKLMEPEDRPETKRKRRNNHAKPE